MADLTPLHFESFFAELHGYSPFPWQGRLAKRVCETGWPGNLDLPTASGKTACIDVAVFAMALRGRGPRRVFFVVDRRVVVDSTYERMRKIAEKLGTANGGVLKTVADRLRELARGDQPLATYQLRGGIYRDDSWVRTPLQPLLVASTVDQVGSRLLFRGYGVGDKTLPLHAGLVANDSLVLLDEAHSSRPFSETLAAIQRYRGADWAKQNLDSPFAFVEMTATRALRPDEPFRLEDEDFAHPEMRKRLYARKPARLVAIKARANDLGKLAENLADEAARLAAKPGLRRVAVMVNRVRTARLAYAALRRSGHRTHLLMGRTRPIDQMALPADVDVMMSGNPRTQDREPVFVVATQCLEVGADLDFDAVVTECASIDALLQRFGRLDRIGDLHQLGVRAEGCVMVAAAMAGPKYRDPVYGEALTKTWKWLRDSGDEVDFGLCSEAGDATVRERFQAAGEQAEGLRREARKAPVLLPAHLDALVQTSPRPALEPDIGLYLHGEENGSPEVQVVWRADLNSGKPQEWAEIVSLCPPVSTEAMAVPLREFRAWLTMSGDGGASASDIEGLDAEPGQEEGGQLRCPVLCWRGDESDLIKTANDVRPGDTLILAMAGGGWTELGHIPEGADIDVAERARHAQRRGWILRLHPYLLGQWPKSAARDRLIEISGQPVVEKDDVLRSLEEHKEPAPRWLVQMLNDLPKGLDLDAYPTDDGAPAGWVLSAPFAEADSGGDESSTAPPVFLDKHLEDVVRAASGAASGLLASEEIRTSLVRAARFHDWGKADPRFQALLRGGDPMAAQLAPRLLAKGSQARQSKQVRSAQWARSGLPDGFRHELISLLFAQAQPDIAEDDLALHLIASHHGRCRPFAPVVEDTGGNLTYSGQLVTTTQRIAGVPHRLENGVADRFWRLTRQYGWWGLAYLESLLRLGDWQASNEDANTQRGKL